MVKNLPARPKIQVQSLDWEDPLEEGMATHSIILAWRIPWTEEPRGLQSLGSQRYIKRILHLFSGFIIFYCVKRLIYLTGPLLMVLRRHPVFHNINTIAVNNLGPFDNIV